MNVCASHHRSWLLTVGAHILSMTLGMLSLTISCPRMHVQEPWSNEILPLAYQSRWYMHHVTVLKWEPCVNVCDCLHWLWLSTMGFSMLTVVMGNALSVYAILKVGIHLIMRNGTSRREWDHLHTYHRYVTKAQSVVLCAHHRSSLVIVRLIIGPWFTTDSWEQALPILMHWDSPSSTVFF